MKTNVNLTGMVFGRLTAIRQDMSLKGHSYWICLCSCGIQKSVREKSLMHAITKSCGCLNKDPFSRKVEDLSGRIFGKLTVIRRDESKINIKKGSYWICQCECGNMAYPSRKSLMDGTRSCGCLQKDIASGKAKPYAGSDKNAWLAKYKRRARDNNVEFTLTDEEFFTICSKNCFYCDVPPSHKSHGYITKKDVGQYLANGIDKIDPTIGYVIYNCVPCCKMCNFMKTNKSLDVFVNKIFEIADNMRKKQNEL